MLATDRASTVTRLIERRNPLVRTIEGAIANLQDLRGALSDLRAERDSLLGAIDDLVVQGSLRDLDFDSSIQRIDGSASALGKLKARFKRETINIATVGRAGMGKSTLLQSITGLTSAQIPSGGGQHCTGVRSTIVHTDETTPHGEVVFYSEREFLDQVIAPYFHQLGLGFPPATLTSFASMRLPDLPKQADEYEAAAKYEHLRTYHDHLADYRDLIGKGRTRIKMDQIRTYVAQDTEAGQRTYFNYLASKEVVIYCPFPHADVGRIAVIDMPGLGDTGVGNEELLLRVLGEDVDIILFVKKPNIGRDYWGDVDMKLFDLAARSLTALPLDAWAFLVINRTRPGPNSADNERLCLDLLESMAKQRHRFTKSLIVDAQDTQEVSHNLVDSVLSYLEDSITQLDTEYASVCQRELDELRSGIALLLDVAKDSLGAGTPAEGEYTRFHQLFEGLWSDLTNGLRVLVGRLHGEGGTPNEQFEAGVARCIQSCRTDTGIPSIEEIERTAGETNAYSTAFARALDRVRTHLVEQFWALDDPLQVPIDAARSQLTDVLKSEGRLAALGDAEGTEFLRGLTEWFPKQLSILRAASGKLIDVKLTYDGFYQYRMPRHLTCLLPDSAGRLVSSQPTAAKVRRALEVVHDEAVSNLEEAFDDWLAEPGQVAVGIVELFVDRVLRTAGAQEEWRTFYLSRRGLIWQSEFDRLGQQSELRQRWERLVERAAHANGAAALA